MRDVLIDVLKVNALYVCYIVGVGLKISTWGWALALAY
tara:strand:- start:1669 stop:1782 length:114 start_codon:yes stop_codon:yes gene_type:complete